MDVDYGGSINKYILSFNCVPSSVLDRIGDKGYVPQFIKEDTINELCVTDREIGTCGLKMGQDI